MGNGGIALFHINFKVGWLSNYEYIKEAYTSIIFLCVVELYVCVYFVYLCIDKVGVCSFGVR